MATKTSVDKVVERLQAALVESYEAQAGILRQGDRIIIPAFMNYKDAATAIMAYEKKMEEEVQTMMEFSCHPNDGMVAFYRAMKTAFGELAGAASWSFFGKIPGRSLAVPISYTETVVVPIGKAEIPGLPITFDIRPALDKEKELGGNMVVICTYRRKFEPLIKKIEQLARQELKDHPIFKGKAIDSDFNFLNVDEFDPSSVIFSESEQRMVDANILAPIKKTDAWKASGSSVKRGVLLYGPYGTGKTLTALLTAKEAVSHGWTFIMVRSGSDIATAIRVAKYYEPAVVFFEDIDQDTAGERNEVINNILNTTDGLLSKNSQVMIILTTNHVEYVNRGMLRPGRLDSIIKLGSLDRASLKKLIIRSAHGTIEGDLDMDAIEKAAFEYVPAYVVEAVTKAKAYALAADGSGELRINSNHIVSAMEELRFQWNLMNTDQTMKKPNLDQAMNDLVSGRVLTLEASLEEIKKAVE
jgi:transitional endoplasmic reticulum ATPase